MLIVIAAEVGTLGECDKAKTDDFSCKFVAPWYFVVDPSSWLDIFESKGLGDLLFGTED
jgi:hypothetical protein